MRKPIVGVIGNSYRVEDRYQTQLTGQSNLSALADVSNALPFVFAGTPDITDINDLLDAVDGILLTGARANVHPTHFETTPEEAYEPYDQDRDNLALELTRVCVERGVPLFGICRGMQEMNVAFGGSLHPEIRDVPGHMNHRMPRLDTGEIHPDPDVVFADRHDVTFTPNGKFEELYRKPKIRVNSLHGQAVLKAGDRVNIEGYAEDTTVEAISIDGSSSFALGIQWHAEYDPQTNPVNRILFEAFGKSLKKAIHNG